ncbi:MAG TPA: hypothetical protein VGD78_12935 [Chthoniobacterales bacterium]
MSSGPAGEPASPFRLARRARMPLADQLHPHVPCRMLLHGKITWAEVCEDPQLQDLPSALGTAG